MDLPVISAPRQKQRREPRLASLEVGEFDDYGTARAQFNNRSVEVEHGIPGESVAALVHGRRRQWAKILEIEEPSPDRVQAPCPHFHQGCGGCQWQMLDYRNQVERKRQRTNTELRLAGLGLDIIDLHPMDDPWRYRVTAGISLGYGAGFRRHGSQSIVALADCPISHPLIGSVAAHINAQLESGVLPNFRGDMVVEVRVLQGDSAESLHLAIVPSPGSQHASVEQVLPLAKSLARLPPVTGIVYRHRQDPPQLIFGEPYGATRIAGRRFAVSAATFLQTNMRMLPLLLRSMDAAHRSVSGEVVVDVYGGVGLFGLFRAHEGSRVIEIELDPVGIEAAQLSAAWQHLDNVEFRTGTAELVMAQIEHADTVIVDPPRSGLTPKVVDALGRLRPRRILYVSCLARSLARDIVDLARFGYRPRYVEGFDFYPQTYHVELFSPLELVDG